MKRHELPWLQDEGPIHLPSRYIVDGKLIRRVHYRCKGRQHARG
jgi:hypothetical protein